MLFRENLIMSADLLGIPITTPSRRVFAASVVVALLGVVLSIGLKTIGLFTTHAAVVLSASIAGGSFATAVGVRIPDQGWRGLFLTVLSGALFVGVALTALYLFF